VHGKDVCLYRLGNRIYASQDLCTHGYASLADGYVIGENVECPMHGGMFHIPTGRAVQLPCTENLVMFPARTENGEILVGMPSDRQGASIENERVAGHED
jgi:nitrite reductase/ring-hydroxylating ferredoxin subunit